MPNFNAFIIACALVQDEDRVLLIEEDRLGKQQLNTPGGRVRSSEDPRSCAIHEVREETGLDIEVSNLLYIIQGTWPDGGNFARFVYAAKKLGGIETPEKNHQLHWISLEQLCKPEMLPVQLFSLETDALQDYAIRAVAGIEQPAIPQYCFQPLNNDLIRVV